MNIEKEVFDAIKSGKAKMRPKWVFFLRAVLAATGAVVLFAFLVYFASLAIFVLHENGAWFAYNFGISGWYLFFRSLPIALMLLLLLFTIAVAMLARRYAFVYHRPLVYLLLVIAGLTTAASFLIAPTALHRAVINYATENHIPFINEFYEFEGETPGDVHQGQIVMFQGGGFILKDIYGGTTTVIFTPTTSFGVGDIIVVFGGSDVNGAIHPFGVTKIAP